MQQLHYLPAVINSFLFLSSVKKIVEHRQIKNPVEFTAESKLKSTDENHAPITLVRLIVASKALSEKQIGFAIFKLATFSGILIYNYGIFNGCVSLKAGIYGFLFAMWILILIGGGIVVTLLGSITITGYGDMNWFIASVIKAGIAILLVVIWIIVLTKMKNWIFKKENKILTF